MADEALAFDKWVEEMGWAARWRAEGAAEGEARGEARGEAQGEKRGWGKAINLLKQGYTLEEIEQMDPSVPNGGK